MGTLPLSHASARPARGMRHCPLWRMETQLSNPAVGGPLPLPLPVAPRRGEGQGETNLTPDPSPHGRGGCGGWSGRSGMLQFAAGSEAVVASNGPPALGSEAMRGPSLSHGGWGWTSATKGGAASTENMSQGQRAYWRPRGDLPLSSSVPRGCSATGQHAATSKSGRSWVDQHTQRALSSPFTIGRVFLSRNGQRAPASEGRASRGERCPEVKCNGGG